MLGIVLLFFIGKYFYKLAEEFSQNKWLYAILGIVSYYFGAIVIGGVSIGLFIEFFTDEYIDNYSETTLGYMVLPFGIGFTYLFYYLLKRKWKKSLTLVKDEIQDIGKSVEELNEKN